MTYNKIFEDRDYNGVIPQRIDSPALRKILLTPEYILEKLEKGGDPIQLSIDKWEKIKEAYNFIAHDGFKRAYYGYIYHLSGANTCALCIVAKKEYEKECGFQKYQGDKCIKCVLSTIEPCYDINSVYSNITYLLGYRLPEYYKDQPDLIVRGLSTDEEFPLLGKNIDIMIERLRSLQ
ncbi:MAG TPA: hypothetical protein PK544_09970 [Spirochaetota bacterium]|nr:hypothetical protein [Spirochaetota bacterium]HPQ53620.1 hypothetical protein [Spirochaetota bacterium]